MKKEWVFFKQLGELYVEQVLVQMDVPIFFICVNEVMERFACLTIDDEIGQYIVKRVELKELIETIENQITLYDLFKNGKEKLLYLTEYDFDNQIMNDKIINTNDISDEYLPKKGEYFEFVSDKIGKYIKYLKSMDILIETGWYSEHNKNYIIPKQKSFTYNTNQFYQEKIRTYHLDINKITKHNIFIDEKDSYFVA